MTSLSIAALVLTAMCLYLMLPRSSLRMRRVGAVLGLVAFALYVALMPLSWPLVERITFWNLAGIAVLAAIMAISVRSAVYTAIWFAISLMGVAGLFLFQGAQFLGVVTLVVYAGAIVVMFLFVIMLAQPEGHSLYDRIAWGSLPKSLSIVTVTLVLAVLVWMIANDHFIDTAKQSAAREPNRVLAVAHTANLGRELFSRHLVTVELAGTLLLAALVGAMAIAMHGKSQRDVTGDHLS
jgi:NADH-quinone oxidoreductase subunit J